MGKQVIYVEPERLKPLIHGNKVFKSADDFSVTEEDLRKAHKELGETEEVRIASLQKLKEKIKGDQTVRYNLNENFLLRYLRYAKYDVNKAFRVLRQAYVFRANYPNVFNLSNVEKMLNEGLMTYLPYLDEENCFVYYFRFRLWDPDRWSLWDITSLYNAISEIITLNPNVQIHGVKGMWDLGGTSLKQVATLLSIKATLFYPRMFQENLPFRIKKIVWLNTNFFIRTSFNTIRPLLKKKLIDRIVMLGSSVSNINELHKYFNPAILPKELGGKLEEHEYCMTRHIMSNRKYLEKASGFGLLSETK